MQLFLFNDFIFNSNITWKFSFLILYSLNILYVNVSKQSCSCPIVIQGKRKIATIKNKYCIYTIVKNNKNQFCHNLSTLSLPPVATLRPSVDQSTANTSSACPGKSISSFLVFKFHNFNVESALPLTINLESAENDIIYTAWTWPRRVQINLPVFDCQSLIDLSKDAEANIRPSGVNLTSFTNCWCPKRMYKCKKNKLNNSCDNLLA